jgi:hypothetical protein
MFEQPIMTSEVNWTPARTRSLGVQRGTILAAACLACRSSTRRSSRGAKSWSGEEAATERTIAGGLGFSVREQTPENTGKTGISADAGANAGAVETKTAHIGPDLQGIIDAWPALPDAIKAGILAMIRAAGGTP